MDAANAAAAERGSFLNSSRAIVEKGVTPSLYRNRPDSSIFDHVGNVAAEIVLRVICRVVGCPGPLAEH